MKVRIKRVDKSLPLPKYETAGAAGFDIYSRIDAVIKPKEYSVLPNNLIIETPKGYMLMMVARSSTYRRTGLILPNSAAIFDQDFCGNEDEMLIQVYNLSDKEVVVKKGDRIAQGIFVRIDNGEWVEVNDMENETRGGIGSTGYKTVEL